MRAILINQPNDPAPVAIDAKDSIEFLHETLAGHFDCVPFVNHVGYVNDHGLLLRLPAIDITVPKCHEVRLAGPIIIFGHDGFGNNIDATIEPEDIIWKTTKEVALEMTHDMEMLQNGMFHMGQKIRWGLLH